MIFFTKLDVLLVTKDTSSVGACIIRGLNNLKGHQTGKPSCGYYERTLGCAYNFW